LRECGDFNSFGGALVQILRSIHPVTRRLAMVDLGGRPGGGDETRAP
jgi:hypothetical protein